MNTAKHIHNHTFPSRLTAVCLAVLSCTAAAPALADTDVTETVQLNEVVVKGKKKARRKDTEVTGLGKVVKNSDGLDKEQVLGIRDLTRYDPSIAVVEQGRGASSGYSMRGVDRNRVNLTVDGLNQIQSYTVGRTLASSGAINEIEYENIKEIEINKGANSAEQGSGALGGSFAFRTKEASDIIKSEQNWGLDTKTAYSGKNKQFTQSVAAAGHLNGFEGLAIFTLRKGKETQVHKDAGEHRQEILRQVVQTEESNTGRGWFVLEGECADKSNCDKTRIKASGHADAVEKMLIPSSEYTGSKRIQANPMDYQSNSWFLKGGYHFSPEHYLGGVLEDTRQQYDIRDMTFEQYWPSDKKILNRIDITKTKGIYPYGGNALSGLVVSEAEDRAAGLNYSRLRYFDEQHKKTRKGLLYRYQNENKNSMLDKAELSFDHQNITLDSHMHRLHCSVYPEVDKDCRPSLNKPWSLYESDRTVYGEKHNLLQFRGQKKFVFGNTEHKLNLGLGFNRFRSELNRKDLFIDNVQQKVEFIGGNYLKNDPNEYRLHSPSIYRSHFCLTDGTVGVFDCRPRTIQGSNHYISFHDHVKLGKYFDWGGGIRYDRHKMTSDDIWASKGTFRNTSWNSGFVFKPTSYLSLLHRISNGFRVPSFQEMFGGHIDGFQQGKDEDVRYIGKFNSEKALNHEVGIHLKGSFGNFEVSYFRNKYKDLIGLTHVSSRITGLSNSETARGYRNMYNATTDGINIVGKVDWHGITDKLPEGLYSTVAYNHVKLKKASLTKDYFVHSCGMLFDAIQPSRYVLGLGYDAPSGKWGVNGMMTYSKAKNPDELQTVCKTGYLVHNESATKKATKPWYVFDVSGYVNLKDKMTLRAGIYNLANRRYSQWENVRQSAMGAVNQQTKVENYARYAAPGRNLTVSMEMKF
ncbi:MAG: lactoferrin/transferrin family TonB-dependent receptor [Neisseria zoodegmatis]|uniref:lactoferrin/transferrin family TonB-dependent receptor n=1 Tax=Neisseria zoodegmatis TaxID=326523 RepID=UPI0026F1C4BD|nr:lactoferrin/transferrin family TonB-dependent receptor [Neisseria zoodegmatis]MDO5069271.1 lactoferrin/transferrin family TonB-dependent receptor [Neisseria zoodegmatis]